MSIIKKIQNYYSANKIFTLSMAAFIGVRLFALDYHLVPTGSMNPTILEGDFVLTNKLAYGLRIPFTEQWLLKGADPVRGSVVVFSSPTDGTTLIKRLIALPGDTVELRNELVYVNGKPFGYKELPVTVLAGMSEQARKGGPVVFRETLPEGSSHDTVFYFSKEAKRNYGPVQVPANQYFMMGDNRDNSADSRYVGFVPREKLIGHSFSKLVSLNPEHGFLPRWERFGTKLD